MPGPNLEHVAGLDAKIVELETQLDAIDAERIAALKSIKAKGRAVMAERAKLIAQRELHLRENPTPVMGLPNAERLERLRTQAGIATVKISGHG